MQRVWVKMGFAEREEDIIGNSDAPSTDGNDDEDTLPLN